MESSRMKITINLKNTYLIMFLIVLFPIILNLNAPTLMGKGLSNSILTATILVLYIWFFFSQFREEILRDRFGPLNPSIIYNRGGFRID